MYSTENFYIRAKLANLERTHVTVYTFSMTANPTMALKVRYVGLNVPSPQQAAQLFQQYETFPLPQTFGSFSVGNLHIWAGRSLTFRALLLLPKWESKYLFHPQLNAQPREQFCEKALADAEICDEQFTEWRS